MKIFSFSRRTMLACVLGIAAIGYVQSLTHSFVLDDHDLLERVIPSLQTPIDAWKTGNAFQSYYRPVFLTSLYLDHQLFGDQAWGFHAINLILHLLATWCAFVLAEKIFRNPTAAAASALLFAIQPVHTENVSWVSGRTDILCAIFVFLSLSAFYDLAARRNWKSAWLSAIYFFLALGSKETAIVMPALCLLLLTVWKYLPAETPAPQTAEQPKRKRKTKEFVRRKPIKPVVLAMVLFVCGAAALMALRSAVMKNDFTENTFTTSWELSLNAVRCLALYLYHSVVAGGYEYIITGWRIMDSQLNLQLPKDAMDWVFIGTGALAYLAALGAALYWKRGAAIAGFTGFFLFLLPALGIVPIQSIFSVRFLYIPSFFFSLALVDGVRLGLEKISFASKYIIIASALGAVVVWWSYATYAQDANWKNDSTLFGSMKDAAPDSPVMHFSLGNGYRYNGEYLKAAGEFMLAEEIFPRYRDAYINLAGCYLKLAEKHPEYYSQAVDAYQNALKKYPSDPLFYMLLGDTYVRMGDMVMARQDYALAFSLDKDSPEVRKRLDRLHIELPGM